MGILIAKGYSSVQIFGTVILFLIILIILEVQIKKIIINIRNKKKIREQEKSIKSTVEKVAEAGFGEELSGDKNNDNESENDNVSNEIIKEDETSNSNKVNLKELLDTIKNYPEKVKIEVEHIKEFKGWYQTQNNLSVLNNINVSDYNYKDFNQNCLDMGSSEKKWEKVHIKSPAFNEYFTNHINVNEKKKIFFGKYTCMFTALINLTTKDNYNSETIIETIQELLDSNKQSIDSLYEVLYEKGNELHGVPEDGETLEESIGLCFEALKYEVFENGKEKNLIIFDDYNEGCECEWKLKILINNSILLDERKKTIKNNVISPQGIEFLYRKFIAMAEMFIEEPSKDMLGKLIDVLESSGRNKKSREAFIPCNMKEHTTAGIAFVELLSEYQKGEINETQLIKKTNQNTQNFVMEVQGRLFFDSALKNKT